MKKMLLATRMGSAYYRMCSTDVYCSKQTAAVAPKETITHHFFVSGIGQKKTVDAAKICGGAENVVKTETQQTFVNGLLGFITLGICYSAGSVGTIGDCTSCPSIWATPFALLINILLGSFQLFFA